MRRTLLSGSARRLISRKDDSMAGIPWKALSEAYGFLGNSLLAPMTMTASVGLDGRFWEAFPTFGDQGLTDAVAACVCWTQSVRSRAEESGEDSVERCAVEYTRLFIGPPSPLAPPWETMYRASNVTVGFGQATFEMRQLLREAGFELRNDNRQYEDHMGIELLYLSDRCRWLSGDPVEIVDARQKLASFIDDHPLDWIGSFRDCVEEQSPDGYFSRILLVTQCLLKWHRAELSAL